MSKVKLTMNIFCLFLAAVLISCGGSGGGSSSSTDSGGDSGGGTSGSITLTGTLGTASGKVSGTLEAAAVDSYTVVAVDNSSNKTYNTTANSGAAFSLDLPSGSTYLLSFIKDGSYVGPTVFNGSGAEVNTAITPSSDTELGSVEIDTTNGYATTSTVPDALEESVTVNASGGKPLGAGNDGKTKNSGITNGSDSDKDKDGIPNIFDADEDNDGVRNGISSTPSSVAVVSDVVESVYMSSNIWADHDTTLDAEDLIALRLHVVPESGQESLIAGVQCTSVPSSIENVATVRWASSLGDPTGYPSENSLWKDDSYNLYKTTTLSPEEWIVSITPKAIMNVGDTFTIRVTYTDATYEDFFVSMAYVLTDWAAITSYNGTTMPLATGTSASPVSFNADTLEIIFSKPLDEDGNVLSGLTYSVRYAESTFDSGANRWLVPETVTEESVTDTGGATLTHTINTSTSATYYVTPVAESADGQRNGEETWFTRE